MVALARLLIIALIVLTVIHVSLASYCRAVRREKLARRWEADGRPGERDAYVAEGMRDYEHSLRRRLVLGVYVVPLTAMILIIYVTNLG